MLFQDLSSVSASDWLLVRKVELVRGQLRRTASAVVIDGLVVLASDAAARELADSSQQLLFGPPAQRDVTRLVVLEVDHSELFEELIVVLERDELFVLELRGCVLRVFLLVTQEAVILTQDVPVGPPACLQLS